ncbi:GntR family transcriptional regulator [Ligilactobacillus sp. Marseille-Q7487]|jgi:DNA-binding GntR family transcriptional regulator|uniref:GntR family transcriptional regulator n=1 Tax=Ligilactobacillus sp. Marseille-Q7487 TaxID=3022128 RepID=UPI0015B38FD6|nr:GntR family transcriptional regulator [Ligilactobacillus sp. Marseille-Q7487]
MNLPKHQIVKNDLKSRITSGQFSSGDKFYSEAELVKMYNVSSITVIRAVKDLVKEGYLVRYQGKGTFVSRKRVQRQVKFTDKEIFSTSEDFVKVLSITRENDPQILKKMHLTEADFYYVIVRLRTAKDVPYIYHHSYIPERFIKYPQKLDYYNSIYHRFRSDFNINLNDEPSHEINRIVMPPKDVVSALQLEQGQPAVFQEKTTWLANDNSVAEYIITYKRWEFFEIEITTD